MPAKAEMILKTDAVNVRGLVSEWHQNAWVISRLFKAGYLGNFAISVFGSVLEYYSNLGLVCGNSICSRGVRGSGCSFDLLFARSARRVAIGGVSVATTKRIQLWLLCSERAARAVVVSPRQKPGGGGSRVGRGGAGGGARGTGRRVVAWARRSRLGFRVAS